MGQLVDFDLDVFNALKNFPENEENAFLYVRGSVNRNGMEVTVGMTDNPDLMACIIAHMIDENKQDFKQVLFTGLTMYLKSLPESEKNKYLEMLKILIK